MKFAKYEGRTGCILKDGHAMFMCDVAKELNRKSYLEEKVLRLEFMIENGLGENDMHDDTRGDKL